MRSGWDTATRIRPVRFDKVHPFDYEARKIACLDKIATIQPVSLAVDSPGKTYPATDIDVGSEASNRAANYSTSLTLLALENPANDTGTLDTVELWMHSDASGVKVGTFSGSSLTWNDRDYESIGNVTSGSKQTFTGLSIDVSTNDLIGLYFASGAIEMTNIGWSGMLAGSGDHFGSGDNGYLLNNGRTFSLYGTGETASVGARLLSLTGVGT